MAGDTCLELWLNSYRWDALEEALELERANIEDTMQEYLLELYREKVPAERINEIEQRIKSERLEQLQQAEESKIYSAFRIRERGQEQLLQKGQGMEFLDTAILLRRYLRHELPGLPLVFAEALFPATNITENQFDDLVRQRLDNTGKVTGVFEINLDNGIFSALHILDGWQSFRVRDVSTAAYQATRKAHLKRDLRWQKFLAFLAGKQVIMETPAPLEQTAGMTQTM